MGAVNPIRWGILGTGRIARSFAEGLRSVPDAKLVAVGSRTQEAASAFAATFGIPHAYASYSDLANAADVDVVYIATPNIRHKDDCFLCIDAGKAVLCEKPFAMNAIDAQAIVDRARDRGVFFMEAMWMRFIPLVQKVREIVQRGEIGEPCLLQADFGYPINGDPHGRFLNLALGGGSLLDRGIYPLSLAWFLFGPPSEVTGQALLGPTGVDEQSTVLLSYKGGPQAVLTSTMKTYGTNRAIVIGTRGVVKIDAPFYCAERIAVTRYPVSSPAAVSSAAAPPGLEFRVRHLLRRARRAAYRAVGKKVDQVVHASPLEGNGFNYEAAEVGRCLRAGILESATMTGAESIAIIEAMDGLRQRWGIVYPNDPAS